MKRTPAIWPGLLMALLIAVGVMGTQSGAISALQEKLSFTSRPASGSSYELNSVTQQDGTTTTARWNPCQTAITYQVNLARIPAAERATVLAEVRTGFAKLAAATGMTYRYKGATSFVPSKTNLTTQPAEIVVAAAESTDTDLEFGDALGFGGTVWTTWSNSRSSGAAIVRGYVVLSPSGLASLEPGFGAGMTQGNLILHELGHATGMEHAGSSNELMYAELSADSPAGFAHGDLAGLKKLGSSTGCVRIPAGAGLKDLS